MVLGELFFGAAKSRRPLENATRVEQFAAGGSIISCDLRVARESEHDLRRQLHYPVVAHIHLKAAADVAALIAVDQAVQRRIQRREGGSGRGGISGFSGWDG